MATVNLMASIVSLLLITTFWSLSTSWPPKHQVTA